MRLKEEQHNTTGTTDLNNNCVKADDHLVRQTRPVHLQLKRSSTEQGLNGTNYLDSIELKELNNGNQHHVTNQQRTSPISSPHQRQPSPSQFSFNQISHNHSNHSKCNGVCVITNEPKSCNKPHRHLTASQSNGIAVPQKIQIQLNGSAFSPSLTSLSSLNALNQTQHSPLVPSYLSNSSKYTGYSTYGEFVLLFFSFITWQVITPVELTFFSKKVNLFLYH